MLFNSVMKAFQSFLDKRKVSEEVDLAADDHKSTAVLLTTYLNYIEGSKLKYDEPAKVKSLANIYFRTVEKKLDSKSLLKDIDLKYRNVTANLDTLTTYISNHVRTDIVSGAVTVQQSVSMYLLCSLIFANQYVVSLLSYIVDQQKIGNMEAIEPPFTLKFIEDNVVVFATVLNLLSLEKAEFSALLNEATDTVINEQTLPAISQIFSSSKLAKVFSAFNNEKNFNRIVLNIRMIFASSSVEQYKVQKEKKQQLELRLLQLQMESEGKSDPRLQKEIEYIQSRVEKLQSAIDKFESKYKD